MPAVSKLQRLAKHYLPGGWESWGQDDPDNSDATDFAEMELAVAAHPEICLRALAENWGLEYGHLQRPGASRKRKAENEPESREGKMRKVDEEISLQNDSEEVFVRRVTRSEAGVIHTSRTLRDVLKECREPEEQEQPQLSPGSGNRMVHIIYASGKTSNSCSNWSKSTCITRSNETWQVS